MLIPKEQALHYETSTHLVIGSRSYLKTLHSLKLTARPSKLVVGRRSLLSYWGPVTFQGRHVELREGKRDDLLIALFKPISPKRKKHSWPHIRLKMEDGV